MAQIFHVFKLKIPLIIRNYGNHKIPRRSDYNYYEVLRISQNATQKEIKDAYIKLSKELHPDVGNRGNHVDFVKINEAYSVLSKKGKRQIYDRNLRYNNMRCNQTSFNQNNYYQQDHYYTYRGPTTQWTPRRDNVNDIRFSLYIRTIFIIIGLFMIIEVFIQNKRRLIMMQIRRHREYDYKTLENNAQDRTDEEQMQFVDNLNTKFNSSPDKK